MGLPFMIGPTEEIVSEQQKSKTVFFNSSQSKDTFLVLFFFSKIVFPENDFTANHSFCFLVLLRKAFVTFSVTFFIR